MKTDKIFIFCDKVCWLIDISGSVSKPIIYFAKVLLCFSGKSHDALKCKAEQQMWQCSDISSSSCTPLVGWLVGGLFGWLAGWSTFQSKNSITCIARLSDAPLPDARGYWVFDYPISQQILVLAPFQRNGYFREMSISQEFRRVINRVWPFLLQKFILLFIIK